jgi:hypothetical protein
MPRPGMAACVLCSLKECCSQEGEACLAPTIAFAPTIDTYTSQRTSPGGAAEYSPMA